MPVDVENAGVPIDELAEASDPRTMRVAAGGFRTQPSDVGTLAGGASINPRPALMLYGLRRKRPSDLVAA